MARNALPDREYIREVLDYDPASGEFRWLERPRSHFSTLRSCRVWNTRYAGTVAGTIRWNGYLMISLKPSDEPKQQYRAHRIAWLLVHGDPIPEEIDHINGDRADNSVANLRAATHTQNQTNQRNQKRTLSGLKGVHLMSGGKYRAHIVVANRQYHLGCFPTLEEAAAARREAAERLHGEFARHE